MVQNPPNGKCDPKSQPAEPLSQRQVPSVVVRIELFRAPQSSRIVKTTWQAVVPATDHFEPGRKDDEFMVAAYDIAMTIIRAAAIDYAHEMKDRGGTS